MLRGCARFSGVCGIWTDFNSLAYHIPASSVDYQRIHSSTAQSEIGTVDCPYSIPWTIQGLCISINCRLSEVLHQLWWKGVATLPWVARDIHLYRYFNSAIPMHLDLLCTQHCRHVRSLWSFRSLQLVEVWPYLEERKKGYVLWLNGAS